MLSIQTEPKVKMTMTVKKDKVKVRKSHPLKGAFIDIDYNTELTEVFGEKEGFEEKPVDLFSEENAIIDDENKEVWDDIKQDIVYETEKQKLLKQLENLEQENALRKNAKKYKSHIVDRLNADIKKKEDAIKKLQDELYTFEEQLVELETIEIDADIMDYLADNFSDEVNILINEDTPDEPVKAKRKPATKGGQPAFKGTRQTTTEERWNLLENGSMFRAKHKEVIRYYMKVAEGKVAECDKEGNLNIEKDSFENNQDAANDFRKIANISYSISGWEFLQLYNKDTDKAKSLKKWDGVLEYLVW